MNEALPAVGVVLVFVAGICLSVYLIFSRAYIQYQSEQALYCLGEARTESICRERLERKLKSALPFGRPGSVKLQRAWRRKTEIWRSEVRWKIRNYEIAVNKSLDTRALIRSRALRW